jgi:hypothetical protein
LPSFSTSCKLGIIPWSRVGGVALAALVGGLVGLWVAFQIGASEAVTIGERATDVHREVPWLVAVAGVVAGMFVATLIAGVLLMRQQAKEASGQLN